MKVIFKQLKTQEFEAIKVSELQDGQLLTDTEQCKQIVKIIDNIKYIVEDSKDNNERYTSDTHIEIKLKEDEYIIKTEKGYTVPIYPVMELTEEVERAIEILR